MIQNKPHMCGCEMLRGPLFWCTCRMTTHSTEYRKCETYAAGMHHFLNIKWSFSHTSILACITHMRWEAEFSITSNQINIYIFRRCITISLKEKKSWTTRVTLLKCWCTYSKVENGEEGSERTYENKVPQAHPLLFI